MRHKHHTSAFHLALYKRNKRLRQRGGWVPENLLQWQKASIYHQSPAVSKPGLPLSQLNATTPIHTLIEHDNIKTTAKPEIQTKKRKKGGNVSYTNHLNFLY